MSATGGVVRADLFYGDSLLVADHQVGDFSNVKIVHHFKDINRLQYPSPLLTYPSFKFSATICWKILFDDNARDKR